MVNVTSVNALAEVAVADAVARTVHDPAEA